MNKSLLLTATCFYLLTAGHAQTPVTGSMFNYSAFTPQKKNITAELQSLTDKKFYDHPEYGVLPYGAPCKDCFELLQKRDESHRYYVIEGTKGKEFYQETSYGVENYKDGNGLLLSVDPRIRPSSQAGVFTAGQQLMPVSINVAQKFSSIVHNGKELQFNRDVQIYIKHKDGSVSSLGQPSWTDYTAGDDGVLIHNFYPGIDLEMRVQKGAMKSNYRINKPLHLEDGWLVVHDNVKLPDGLSYDYSSSDKQDNNMYEGMLAINDGGGTRYFIIASPAAYDENKENNNAINLPYQANADGAYDMYVPLDWMNSAERSYPLIIDPFVTAVSTLPMANISGSGYSPTCFANGCPYPLNVVVPPACNIKDIRYTFYYGGLGTCNINQGAFDLTYGACRSPALAGTWHTCTIGLPGVCQSDSLSCFHPPYDNIMACIPAPQCASYTLPFTLTFYRCVQPGAGCGFSCIAAVEKNWIMYVRGRTTEITQINVNPGNKTICKGGNATITAIADSGIAPYTYTWYPGAYNGNPFNATPFVTTTYTVYASACSGSDTISSTVTIIVDTTCTAGILESQLSNLYSVYPNPSKGIFTIQSDAMIHGDIELTIYNMLGETIYFDAIKSDDIKKGYQLHLNSFDGLYLLVLHSDGGVMGKKISVLK